MKELLLEFIFSDWFINAIYAYLYALLTYMIYSTLNYFKYHSRMKQNLLSLYNQLSDQEKNRAEIEREQRDIHGEGLKKDFLASIDESLTYSGIKDKLKWMSTELFLVLVLLIASVVLILTITFVGFIEGLIAAALVIFSFIILITILATVRSRKIEQSMLQFMNIVDNFSKSSDDIIQILEKSCKYIDEPLSSQIYDTVVEARNTGDASLALQDLQNKVKNRHFKVLIRNLETSSRYETNYSEIIEDCREIFHEYLQSEKEKRSMQLNGVVEIAAMLIAGIMCVYMLGSMTEEGNTITALMNGGLAGKLILALLAITIVVSVYVMLFQVIKSDN